MYLALFLAFTSLANGAPSHSPKEQLLSRIVAVVNDDIILLDEVNEAAMPLMARFPTSLPESEIKDRRRHLRRQVLDNMIADKLLEQQVKVLHLETSAKEIDAIIDDTRKRNHMDPEQFRAALAAQGLSMDEYREGMRKQLLKMKIINLKVRSRIKVSDQDVKGRYQQQRSQAAEDLRYHVRHIIFLVPQGADKAKEAEAKQRAEQALAKLKAGADFASLAKEISEGPSAKQGGDLGFFKPGDMVPAFEKAATQLKVGELSPPVRTPFGWHIIKLIEKKQGEVAEMKDVENNLREKLYQEEIEKAFLRYIEELKSDAYIDLRLDDSFAADASQIDPKKS